MTYPVPMHTVLDAVDTRALAEFYREFLGLQYRPGDDEDWIVLLAADGSRRLAFQKVPTLARPTWPSHEVPKQMHIDFRVPGLDELQRQRARAESLGAVVLLDRTDDPEEPLYVFADPAGHPFCVLVGV